MIRKWKSILIMMLLVGTLCGCGEAKEYQVNPVDANNLNSSNGFECIMKGENGYYYSRQTEYPYEFHYVDNATGKDIYLCSKPECLHQGDEFCTATNKDYMVISTQLYDGKIYISAYDEREMDTGLRIVLLRLEPDGSGLTELAVLKEENTPVQGMMYRGELFIHRGLVFASYSLILDDRKDNGTAIYNLLDGSVSELEELVFALSTEGYNGFMGVEMGRERFTAMGNYVYYCENRPMNEGKRSQMFLCRYNIEDGSTQEAKLEGVFKGAYCALDDERMAYSDKFGNFNIYEWETQFTKRHGKITTDGSFNVYGENGELETVIFRDTEIVISDMFLYDGQLVISSNMDFHDTCAIDVCEDETLRYGLGSTGIYFLNDSYEVVKSVDPSVFDNLAQYLDKRVDAYYYMDGDNWAAWGQLALVDEDVYVHTRSGLFKILAEDFFNSTGNFEHVY